MTTLAEWVAVHHDARNDGRLTAYVGMLRGMLTETTSYVGGSEAHSLLAIAGECDAYVIHDADLDSLGECKTEAQRIIDLGYKPYLVPTQRGVQVYFIRKLSQFLNKMTAKIADTHLELEIARVHFQ